MYIRIRDEEWNVYRRYAQFYELHKSKKKMFTDVATFPFPPKKALGNKVLLIMLSVLVNVCVSHTVSLAGFICF